MIFKIERDWWDNEMKIQTKTKLELAPNSITYICGCNGYGKSTLLAQIEEGVRRLKADNVEKLFNPFYSIFGDDEKSNICYLSHNVNTSHNKSEQEGMFSKIQDISMSNGEGLSRRLVKGLRIFKSWVEENKDMKDKKFFFFLDDCDSGTSIDVIGEIKALIKEIVGWCASNDVEYYVVLPVNSYEFVCDKDATCIDAATFKQLHFKTYAGYKKYVMKTRQKKDERIAALR